ncbi:MAG: lysoplasmalogenase [Clostridia bacterium]
MFFAALGLGAVATILFLVARVRKGGILGLFTKTLASIFFILTAVFACINRGVFATYSYGIFIIVGLVFGMLGDIWLDLKWIYPQDNNSYTFAGMACFGVGHLFFMYGICSLSGLISCNIWYFIAPVLAGIFFGVATVGLEKLMKLEYGKFKAISAVYGAILATMTCLSFSAYVSSNFTSSIWLVMTIGGVFFIVSDLVLSGMYFDKNRSKNTPINVVINHSTYYMAQYVIASSIMFF